MYAYPKRSLHMYGIAIIQDVSGVWCDRKQRQIDVDVIAEIDCVHSSGSKCLDEPVSECDLLLIRCAAKRGLGKHRFFHG